MAWITSQYCGRQICNHLVCDYCHEALAKRAMAGKPVVKEEIAEEGRDKALQQHATDTLARWKEMMNKFNSDKPDLELRP